MTLKTYFNSIKYKKAIVMTQESIPVGCVPPAFVVREGYDVTSCLIPERAGGGGGHLVVEDCSMTCAPLPREQNDRQV